MFAQAPNWVWAKNPSGNYLEGATSIACDASGNSYVTGYFRSASIAFGSTILTNTSIDSADIFVTKYDASGNVIWAKNFGGTNDDYATGIAIDRIGHSYIVGGFQSASMTMGSTVLINTSAQQTAFYVAGLDTSGNVLWAKSAVATGIANSAIGAGAAVDSVGNIYVHGDFLGTSITFGSTTLMSTDSNSTDIFIIKYDSSGNTLWAKKVGGTNYDWAHCIAVESNGKFHLAGEFWSASVIFGSTTLTNANWGTPDIFVAKFDSSGNALWAKAVGGSFDDVANGIDLDSSGNSYLTGYFEETSMAFDTITITGSGNSEIFVAKYNSQGNALWAKSIGGNMIDAGTSITSDINGNSYVTGIFQSDSISFGSTTFINSNGGTQDIFITKYDPSGNVLWAKSVGGSNSDVTKDICIDVTGNAYITGYFQSPSISFGSTTLTNTGSVDIFIAKIASSVGIEEHSANDNVVIYPNPVTDNLTIEIPAHSFEKKYLFIYNPLGEKIYKQKIISEKIEINLRQQLNGIYLITVERSGEKIFSQKIIKQ